MTTEIGPIPKSEHDAHTKTIPCSDHLTVVMLNMPSCLQFAQHSSKLANWRPPSHTIGEDGKITRLPKHSILQYCCIITWGCIPSHIAHRQLREAAGAPAPNGELPFNAPPLLRISRGSFDCADGDISPHPGNHEKLKIGSCFNTNGIGGAMDEAAKAKIWSCLIGA